MSSVRTPERNRSSMGSVHQQSPSALRQHHSPARKSALGSPVKRPAFLANLQSAGGASRLNSSSGSRNRVTGVAATTSSATVNTPASATSNSASAASSQLSKETSRYSRQLEALKNGAALPARRGGGFSNSSGATGASGSRFSASATAGLLGSGRSSLLLGSSPSLSRTLTSNNIGNNNNGSGATTDGNATSNTTATSTSTTPASDYFSHEPPKTPSSNNNSNRTLFSSSSVSSTPKSVLGKRTSLGIGLYPSTPSQFNIPSLPSPFSASSATIDSVGASTPSGKSNIINNNAMSSQIGARPSTEKTPSTSPQRPRTPGGGGGLSRVTSSSSIISTKSLAAQASSCLTRTVSCGNLTTTKNLEVVKNDWVGAPNSPKKGKRTFNPGDRFIPRRIDMASAQVKIDMAKGSTLHRAPSFSGSSTSTHHHIPVDSLDGSAYSQEVARACGLDLNSRILCFNAEAPSLDSRESSVVRQMYSRHPSFTRSNSNLLLKKRTILTSPEKILDAPGLIDDYYLNLLSWSCTNQLAIGLDKSVFVWNADSGQVESLVTVRGNMDSITSVSWAYDGSSLAVGTFEGDTQVWDVETKTKIRTMSGHAARVGVLAWDKHIVSSGCRDGSIWNHDVRVHNHKVAELSSHTNEVCGLTWRSDGMQLASGANDNIVNIWDARSTVPKYTKTNHTAAVKALAWCPWQLNLLASGGGTYDKQIHFWNSTTGARVNTLNAGSQVTSIIWSKEYKEFMSSHGFPNNNLSVYSYPSMSKVVDIPAAHDSRVLHSAVSPDGQTVATVANDENLKFWKLFEKQPKDGKGGSGSSGKRTKLSLPGSSGSSTGGGLLEDDDGCGGDGGSGGGFLNGKSISSMTRIR
ncbi:ubiquitin-protein transferase activating protein [Linnemannia zychae]|nr:ubiquitin-protein transferase activating protein [Linnemannia zychae]